MKANLSRMLRSGVCLLLALCMVVGMLPMAAFAEETEDSAVETKKVINYVSLGDSMTNGYGLTNYNNNGFETYGEESYANQFAKWLVDKGYAETVNHSQYALSAMRAEDLHFILEFPIDDQEAINIADGEWNEEAWEAKFKAGDWYTWDEFSNNGRFWQNVRKRQGDMIGSTNDAAKKYQEAVANADIVSLGLGNSNWGVFLLGRIMNALGFMGGSPEKDSWIEIEDAMRDNFPEDIKAEILAYSDELRADLKQNETLVAALSEDKVDAMANAIIYTMISYANNFGGAVDRIVELNPDVEIMIVGLMNTMHGMEFRVAEGENGKVDLGEYMYKGLDILNAYLAALPTFMQVKGNWTEATFFYAEAPNVEVMVDKYADYIKDPNFPTIRDRFITEIVGDDGNSMVWSLLRPMVEDLVSGATLVPITRTDVENYEKMTDVEKATYAASTVSGNPQRNTAISCAIYLAFEDAVVASCDPENDATMSLEGMLALQNLDANLFSGVVQYFSDNIGDTSATKVDAAAQTVANLSDGMLTKDMVLALLSGNENLADEVYTGLAYAGIAATVNEQVAEMANLESVDVVTAEDVANMVTGVENAQNLTAYKVVDLLAGDALDAEQVATLDTIGDHMFACAMVAQQITENGTPMTAQEVATVYNTEGYTAITSEVNNAKTQLQEAVEGLQTAKSAMVQAVASMETAKAQAKAAVDDIDVPGMVQMLCMLLALPETLSAGLQSDEVVFGLLNLYARCLIGNGLGAHPSAGGHDSLTAAVTKSYSTGYTAAQKFYDFLEDDSTYDSSVKVGLMKKVLAVVEDKGALEAYPEVAAVLAIYNYLDGEKYISDDQTMDIILYVYKCLTNDNSLSAEELSATAQFIYDTLLRNADLDDADRLDIIENVYEIIKENHYLDDYEKEMKAAEEIYVGLRGLEGKEQLLSDEKIFEIIDRVFDELFNAEEITEATVEALVKEIVEDVLFDTEISAASKIEIVKVVYNALKNNGLITDELVYNEAYKAMASLYKYLRNYMIVNGPEKVLGDAYQFALDNGYIDMLNAALADLKDRVLAELDAYVNGAAPELKNALADLEAQAKALETELAGLKAELEAKVAELEAQMNAAAGQTAADIQATIESTKAAIAEIEQTIAETEAALAEVYAGIEACKATLVDLESAIRYLDNAVVALDGKIAELYAILTNGSNESVEAVMAAVEAAKDTIESTINLVQTAYNSAEDLAETVAALSVKAAKAVQNAAENSLSILEGLSEGMVDCTEGFAEEEKAKLIAKIQAEYGDQIALLENNKELILAAGALAAQVIYDRESQPDGAIPALEKEIETKKAELETAAEEAKAQIEAKITELEAQLTEKKAQVEQEAQDAYDKAVVEAEKQYNTTVAEIEAMIPVLEAELEAKIAEVKAQAEAAYGEIKPIVDAALPVIENVLANSDTIMASIEAAIPAAMQAVEDGINYVIDTWNKAYANATTQAYLLNSDSYYVALGDSSAVAGKNYNSYVDELAAELELSKDEYVNYATELNTALDQLKDLQTNTALQADLAKADLVTVGFSNVTFMSNTVNTLVDQYFSGEAVKPDWTPFVTEEGVKYIDAIRDEIFEGLTTYLDEPMDEETAALVTAAIESYAYGVVAYACTMPELVNAIHGINDDAVIIIVGMYNPMDGVVIDMNGTSLDIGEYVNYLVDAAEIHGTAYSMITGNSIYVNAPDVETLNTKSSLGIMDLVNLYATNCQVLNPSANGHEYIQTCIYNALGLARPSAVRVYGSNRYVTSMNIAKTMKGIANGAAFENVVVANGGDFPDALAGTYLADVKNAPILLVSDGYAAEVAAYIKANMTEGGTIYILGGENSVSKATEETLKSVTANVKRVAGKNRYVTNLEILEEAGASGKELLVVDGNQAWDSLSASSSGCPVLLVNKTLREDQKEYLAGTSFEEITIIGGTNSIPESMEAELSAYCDDIDRVSGSNRYKTSVAVAEYFYGANNKNVVLAWGGNFPDGLCGGALASALNAPVVLTDNAEDVVDNYVKQAYLGVVTGGEGKDGSQITDEEVVEIFELFSTEDIVENPYN